MIELIRGVEVNGKVISQPTGQPLVGANMGMSRPASATSNPRGGNREPRPTRRGATITGCRRARPIST